MRRQESESEVYPFQFAFRQRSDRGPHHRIELQGFREPRAFALRPSKELLKKSENPANGLIRPRPDGVRHVIKPLLPVRGRQHFGTELDHAGLDWRESRYAFEQRSLPGAIGTNQSQQFTFLNRETYAVENEIRPETLRNPACPKQHNPELWHTGTGSREGNDL